MKHPSGNRIIDILCIAVITITVLFVSYVMVRVCICDRFTVSGCSMNPTLDDGEQVYVNKILLGGRIYTNFDFTEGRLECFRLPGIRRMRRGDVAVINNPYPDHWGTVGFRINEVLVKRCVGLPGDTVIISNGYLSGIPGGHISASMFGNEMMMTEVPDSVLDGRGCLKAGFFAGEQGRWTIRDLGPVVIPGKGETIVLDSMAVNRYRWVLEYELQGGALPEGSEYIFRKNWYFFMGDNVLNSKDSRYFGFVPEEYVVGILFGNY